MRRLLGGLALVLLGAVLGAALSAPLSDLRRMLLPPPPQESAAAAWADYTQRIHALGLRILADDFPSATDRDRAEGIRHLVHMMVEGLRWEFDHGGLEPAFLMVSNTDTTGWGAPNVDNSYYRARIDGASSYVLRGNVRGLAEIAIQTSKGDMHQGKIGASETLDLSRLSLDEDGSFTLTISPDPQEGDWLPLASDHTILTVRGYHVDWDRSFDGSFTLEESGREGLAPEPLVEAEAAARLGRAASWTEASLVGWKRWFDAALLGAEPNVPIPPRQVGGGSSTLLYGGLPFHLEDGMALLIEIEDPQAEYFSFQTTRRGWYNPGDWANRQTSLNQAQTHVGSDGRIRFALSAEDPGLPNWLDSEGLRDGFIFYRYIEARNPALPRVRVVAVSGLRSHMPEDTPVVSPEQRRGVIAGRQRHVQRRFHN